MRKQKEIGAEVLSRTGRFQEVAENLKVKEVSVGDRRYVVCLNEEEERKDAAARQAILDHLEEKLAGGAKSLLANKGYARYLKVMKGAVRIDEKAVAAEARYDGKFVLRTNRDLEAEEVARTYKSLWRVERIFRETKSTLEVRPIFHHRDDTSIGHIVAGFLALRLEVDLRRRLEEGRVEVSWPTLMRDLSEVRAVPGGVGRPIVSFADGSSGFGPSGVLGGRGAAALLGDHGGLRCRKLVVTKIFLAAINYQL